MWYDKIIIKFNFMLFRFAILKYIKIESFYLQKYTYGLIHEFSPSQRWSIDLPRKKKKENKINLNSIKFLKNNFFQKHSQKIFNLFD